MNLLADLQSRFSPEQTAWVCAAWQEFPPLWSAMEDDALRRKVLEISDDPRRLTPAFLGLLALEFPRAPQDLTPLPFGLVLPPDWEQRASRALESQRSGQPPQEPPLPHAALVALALRSRFRRRASWRFLASLPGETSLAEWSLPLALLAGLLPEASDLYWHLLLLPSAQDAAWRAFLGQPLPPSEQEASLAALLEALPPALLPSALASLKARRPSLAGVLLADPRFCREGMQSALQEASARVGQVFPAEADRSQAEASPLTAALTALAWLQQGETERPAALLPEESDHPALLSALAVLKHARGEETAALRLARLALEGWKSAPGPHPQVCQALGVTLLALGEPLEAEYALALARAARPADVPLLRLHARAQSLAGQTKTAVHTARLACALSPDEVESRRTLASMLESAGEWEAALRERREIAQAGPESPADHYALGVCALNSGDLHLARQSAERALELAPEDGSSRVLLGRIHAALGNEDLALENYRQAVRTAPHLPAGWLALAEHLRRGGNLSQALETLRTAVQNLPQNAEIHWALGRMYLRAASPAQAIPSLETAARLAGLPLFGDASAREEVPARLDLPRPASPLMVSIAAVLGEAYAALGRHALSLPYLRLAYHSRMRRQQVAYAYACSLRAVHRPAEARLVLEEVLAGHPSETAPYLEYARASLEAGEGYPAATQALETVLRLEPDNAEAHALLAETSVAAGAYTAAWEHYQAVMRSPLMKDPHWMVRLSLGFAHLALSQSEYPSAIAALQAAIQEKPDHAALRQALYQAYRMAGLHLEAREQLESLFPFYAETPATVLWLAEQSLRYGYEDLLQRALQALEASPPEDEDTLARWSILYARKGEPERAARLIARLIASPHTPSALLQRAGESLLREGYASHAIPALESARQRRTSEVPETLYESLAEAYRQSGQAQTALEILSAGLEEHPAAVPLLKQAARLHMQSGQTALALDYLDAVITHHPEDLEARHLMLEIHYQRGELAAAYRHARWVAQYLGEHLAHTATCEQARLLAASLAAELLDFPTARALLHAASPNRTEKGADVLALEAELALHFDEEVHAARLVQRALEVAPRSPRLLALQARLLKRQGTPEEARTVFEEARRLVSPATLVAARRGVAQAALELEDFSAAEALAEPLAENPQRSPWGALLYLEALVRQEAASSLAADLEISASLARGEEPDSRPAEERNPRRILEVARALRECFETQALPLPREFLDWERRAGWVSGALVSLPLLEECLEKDFSSEEAPFCLLAARRGGETFPLPRLAALGKHAPQSPLAWLHLALGLEQGGALEEALQAVEHSLSLSAGASWRWHAGAQFLQARLFYRQGEPRKAYAALRQALALREKETAWQRLAFLAARDVEDAPAIVRHGEILREQKALSASQACSLADAYRASGNPQAAQGVLQEAVQTAPDCADAWLKLAEVEASLGAWGEAARCAEHALQARPEDAAALRLRVEAALHLGDGRAARSRALALTALAPQEAEGWFLLARAWELLSRPEEALSALRKALSLHQAPPVEWHLLFLDLLASQEGAQAALEVIPSLLTLFPQAARLRLLAVQFALEADRDTEALALAQSALQDDALALSKADRAHLHTLTGSILRRGGHLDQAVYHLTEAVHLVPQDAGIWIELGQAYEERRELRRAVQAYARACNLSPEDPRPYRLAGMAYKSLKEYPQAERAIRHAVALSPSDVHLQRLLASLTALNIVHG